MTKKTTNKKDKPFEDDKKFNIKKQGLLFDVECICILPRYMNKSIPVFHRFLAFIETDEEGNTIPTYAKCNNCGAIHYIKDLYTSEIVSNKEDQIPSKEDFYKFFPEELSELCEEYELSLAKVQYINFILKNKLWLPENQITENDNSIIIEAEEEEGHIFLRRLRILNLERFHLENSNNPIEINING